MRNAILTISSAAKTATSGKFGAVLKSTLFAVLLGGEDATLRMLVGGSMVLAAMLIVELSPRRKVEAEVTHIAV